MYQVWKHTYPCIIQVSNMPAITRYVRQHFVPIGGGHLGFSISYHKLEFRNGFLVPENIEMHVLYRFLPCLIKKILTLIDFTCVIAAILIFVILRH